MELTIEQALQQAIAAHKEGKVHEPHRLSGKKRHFLYASDQLLAQLRCQESLESDWESEKQIREEIWQLPSFVLFKL